MIVKPSPGGTPEAVLRLLRGCSHVVITAHERPDGDALGAALGLRRLLASQAVRARVVGLGALPPRYGFLHAEQELEPATDGWAEGADALFVLDCGAFDRVGAFARTADGVLPVVNIDHHDSNAQFGTLNWVDGGASSVGEMIYDLAVCAGWPIDLPAAVALWVAMVTDTGRFSYSNTSAKTLRAAAVLVDAGVEPDVIERQLYQSVPLKEMRLQERALRSLSLYLDGRVATVSLRREDFEALGCGPENAQDVVNLARRVAGVEVGLFFYELMDADVTKVSVRTLPSRDATQLCAAFGGGGHRRAAGCSLPGALASVVAQVLRKVEALWYGSEDDTA